MKHRENSEKFTTLKTDKSLIDYRALTKIGLPAKIDRPCNYLYQHLDNFCSFLLITLNIATDITEQSGSIFFKALLA